MEISSSDDEALVSRKPLPYIFNASLNLFCAGSQL